MSEQEIPQVSWRQVLGFLGACAAIPAGIWMVGHAWSTGSFTTKIWIAGSISLLVGGALGGWRSTREATGKALVFGGLLLLGFAASIVFLLPWAADQAAQEFDRAFHQTTQQAGQSARTWLDGLLGR